MSTSPAAKSTVQAKQNDTFASIAIIVCMIVGLVVYIIFGKVGLDAEGHPKPGNFLGIIYMGGFIVPLLMGLFLLTVVVSIERFLTLGKAAGAGNVTELIRKVKASLSGGNNAAAIAECDKHKSSVANIIRSTVEKYSDVEHDSHMDKDQKLAAIRAATEEATALELPMLEKNLVILATISSVATLMGLLGTVFGMIRAFSAIATAGAPDAVALSNGISEALINTALGISTSAIAIIAYNYFTTKIDGLTYGIDEAGFSIAQNFASKH